MLKAIASLLCVVIGLAFSGCATRTKMPALDQAVAFAPGDTPIYLMTVTLRNDNAPRYQPKMIVAHVEKNGATTKADRLNFLPERKAQHALDPEELGNRCFVRLQTPPGDYTLVGFTSICSGFPFHGMTTAPLLASLPQGAPGIVYLGHVAATVRKRQGDEFRAGPVIPLIDQAATGLSGGTYDIAVEDRWDDDAAEFIARFPALKNVTVAKNILPPFDRAKAQAWWEGALQNSE